MNELSEDFKFTIIEQMQEINKHLVEILRVLIQVRGNTQ